MVSLHLRNVLILIFIGIARYCARSEPCANSNMADGIGVYIDALGEYRDCKFLLQYYPSDLFMGIYTNREYMCTNVTSTDCCSTCAAVLTEIKCQRGQLADAKGVFVAGIDRYFDCKYLRSYYDEDKLIGIYKNRLEYCGATQTGCCKTCAEVRYEEECKHGSVKDGKGVFVEGIDKYFECKFLIQEYAEDKLIGIYTNREAYCANRNTDCCTTCATISRQLTQTTQKPPVTSSSTTSHTTALHKVDELKDVCSNNCIWLADGSYGQCNWLLDEVNNADVYNLRLSICGGGFATGCRKTCAQVLQTTAQPTTQTTTLPTKQTTALPTKQTTTLPTSQTTARPTTQTTTHPTTQTTTQKKSQTTTPMTYSDPQDAGNPVVVVVVSDSLGQNLFDILRNKKMGAEDNKRHAEFDQVINNKFSIFRKNFRKR